MAPSGKEIQAALQRFVDRWDGYAGSERSEAQTFLNELFACYGSDRQQVGARFEDFRSSAGFMDLHWPSVCIIEMKAPHVDVVAAREQMERYWRESANHEADIPAARWVILCNFREFELWEPGRFPGQPRTHFGLDELPDRSDALLFLAGPLLEPVFVEHDRPLTKHAADKISEMYRSLRERNAAPADELQRFVMQTVWCLFAEDLGMLEGWPLQSTVKQLLEEPKRSSAADVGHLFRVLNQKGDHNRRGRLAGTAYVNGELFAEPSAVELDGPELRLLFDASEFDWRQVDPTIFGSLMEGVLGDRRWELGAHYTREDDIMKIVTPTIVRPWTTRIESVSSPSEARALLDELCAFRVLDPACGCGNFLYVAYRELRKLEDRLKHRIGEVARAKGLPVPPPPWPYVPLANMQGIDIESHSVMIARITLWMGHRQMIDRYGAAEDPLPLVALAGIRQSDALATSWPDTDCIIGNPPFLGSQYIRRVLGDEYAERLRSMFNVGIKDLCVYWFRRTVDHLKPGQRAGLVGTNSVSQNRARSASLEYVMEQGGVITDAWSSQKWPGEAKVHVSLVNWIDEPETPPDAFTIDGEVVDGIGADLRESVPGTWNPRELAANARVCFQGPIPVGKGFLISHAEARRLLDLDDADYGDVVRPYLTGDDITDAPDQSPQRWIIDFAQRPLEEAARYPAALAIVRERVKPIREQNNRVARRRRWWLLGEQAIGMRQALEPLSRFAASNRVGKRLLVAWYEPWTLPSDKAQVFAFDDDYSMGILLARVHEAWAWARGGSLKADLSYTPTSVFETFPWPNPTTAHQRELVADASRRLLTRRSMICQSQQTGLTKLYNAMDEGAYTDLKALHCELDEGVVACYGWPKSVAQDDGELVRRLTALNKEIAEGRRSYEPFGYLTDG